MCPNKHGNSDSAQPLNTFILPTSWAEVTKLNIVAEFPGYLGLTVLKLELVVLTLELFICSN